MAQPKRYQAWSPRPSTQTPSPRVHLVSMGEASALCGPWVAAHNGRPAWVRVERFARAQLCKKCYCQYTLAREKRERRHA